MVEVHLIDKNKTVPVKPDDPIFCARRVWDQPAEAIFMQNVENAYQVFVSKLEADGVDRRLSNEENQIVTSMYSLWHVRCCWKNKRLKDQNLLGILPPSTEYSKDDREVLEKHNIVAPKIIGSNVYLPSHQLAGNAIRVKWSHVKRDLQGCYWGMVQSKSGEFIVPDISGNRLFLPVTPTIMFVGGLHEYCVIDEPQLRQLNQQFKLISEQYYFGRQL